MSQSVNERAMTDEELQVMLKFYDPAYKKTGKMSDLEWQIGLKKLHHFQARERKEQEAKLKEAKLKEKEEKQREKEEMKKEKEQRGAEKTVRKSSSVSLINDVSLSVASSNGGKVSAAKEVAPVKKVVPARRGRKTLDNSEVISTKSNDSSSLQNGDNGENDLMIDNDAKNMINAAIKKVTQKKAQATKRGRASMNSVSTTTEEVEPPADPVVKKRNIAPQRGGRKKVQEEPSVAETEAKQVLSPIKETEEVLNTTKTLSPAKNVSPAKTVSPAVTKNGVGVVDVGGVYVDVINVALGKPADKLKITLYILDNKKQWQLLTQSQTQSKGQCTDVISGQQLKKGLYKLNFDTSAYFQRVNLVSSFPGIEIQFEVKDTSERHRISVDIGPYHYATHITHM